MSNIVNTKQERVMNYLVKGKTLSQDSAFSMFSVGNLRATISDIKSDLKNLGFVIYRTTGRSGETRYGVTRKKLLNKRN